MRINIGTSNHHKALFVSPIGTHMWGCVTAVYSRPLSAARDSAFGGTPNTAPAVIALARRAAQIWYRDASVPSKCDLGVVGTRDLKVRLCSVWLKACATAPGAYLWRTGIALGET